MEAELAADVAEAELNLENISDLSELEFVLLDRDGLYIGMGSVIAGVDVDDGLEDEEEEGGRKSEKWVEDLRMEADDNASERFSMSWRDDE